MAKPPSWVAWSAPEPATRLATMLSSRAFAPDSAAISASPIRAPAPRTRDVLHVPLVAVQHEGAGLVAGDRLLGDERGHLGGIAAFQRSGGAADHPADGGDQRGQRGGEDDQAGHRLAPAEPGGGDAFAGPLRRRPRRRRAGAMP